MATREEVFEAINGERDYQASKWFAIDESTLMQGSQPHDHQHTVSEWLMFIEDYVDEAKRVYSREAEPAATDFVLHTLRKIAGLACAAMEENGVLTREVEGARPVGFRRG